MTEAPSIDQKTLNAALLAAGVSAPYASQIASGQREPSLGMAIRIYDQTGLQLGRLKGLTKREIAVARRLVGEAA